MINYNIFKGLHYNGVQLIDFTYGSDEFDSLFLNYFKIFATDYNIVIDFDYNMVRLINTRDSQISFINNLNITSNELFDIIYKKNTNSYTITYDAFCYNDESSLFLQDKFIQRLEYFNSFYKKENVNFKIFVLFKYIQHRAGLLQNNNNTEYSLKYIQNNNEFNILANQINVANFLQINELTLLIKIFEYILLFSKNISLNFKNYKHCKNNQQMFLFLKTCADINNSFFLSDSTEKSIFEKGSKVVTNFGTADIPTFSFLLNYIQNMCDVESQLCKRYFEIICSQFLQYTEIALHEFKNAISILKKINKNPNKF